MWLITCLLHACSALYCELSAGFSCQAVSSGVAGYCCLPDRPSPTPPLLRPLEVRLVRADSWRVPSPTWLGLSDDDIPRVCGAFSEATWQSSWLSIRRFLGKIVIDVTIHMALYLHYFLECPYHVFKMSCTVSKDVNKLWYRSLPATTYCY